MEKSPEDLNISTSNESDAVITYYAVWQQKQKSDVKISL